MRRLPRQLAVPREERLPGTCNPQHPGHQPRLLQPLVPQAPPCLQGSWQRFLSPWGRRSSLQDTNSRSSALETVLKSTHPETF